MSRTTTIDDIKIYSDYDNPKFKVYRKAGNFPSNLTFGFENEIVYDVSDCSDRFNNKVAKFMIKKPYLYLKNECSCNGVELNSHPFTYDFFLSLTKSKKNDFISELSSLHSPQQFYINNSCGYHIHICRSYFNKKHLVKMVKFFYDPKNTKFLFNISRRTRNSFDEWASPYVPYKYGKVRYKFEEIASCGRSKFVREMDDKSSILNLYPYKTIELRLFKGTTNQRVFRAYLEFALAVTMFTKETDYDEISIRSFKKFVKRNIGDYKNLDGLIRNPRK